MMASGPYATDGRASRDSADSPSTGVICSRDTSRARSGGPTKTCQIAAARPERLSLRAVMLVETRAGYEALWRYLHPDVARVDLRLALEGFLDHGFDAL